MPIVERALASVHSVMRLMWKTRLGRFPLETIAQEMAARTYEVRHKDVILTLHAPNALSRFRALTFSTKDRARARTWAFSCVLGRPSWLMWCYLRSTRESPRRKAGSSGLHSRLVIR